MAKSYYSLGRSLSRAEAIAGWCYLPFYLVLLSAGIQYLAAALHVSLTALTINIIYFSVNLLFVLLVFRFPAAAVLRAGLLEFRAGADLRLRALLRGHMGRAGARASSGRSGHHL